MNNFFDEMELAAQDMLDMNEQLFEEYSDPTDPTDPTPIPDELSESSIEMETPDHTEEDVDNYGE